MVVNVVWSMKMPNSQTLSNMIVFQPPLLQNNLAKETFQHIVYRVNYLHSPRQAWMLFGCITL
jgi:hypothetical protein